jgi:hypothetical protein
MYFRSYTRKPATAKFDEGKAQTLQQNKIRSAQTAAPKSNIAGFQQLIVRALQVGLKRCGWAVLHTNRCPAWPQTPPHTQGMINHPNTRLFGVNADMCKIYRHCG